MNNYENRQFYIFDVTELPLIDFSQVLETSSDTIRRSVDGTKTFVKCDGDCPICIENLTTMEGPYTYEEMLTILSGTAWSSTDPLIW